MSEDKKNHDGPAIPEIDKVINLRVDEEGNVTWSTENIVSVYELVGLLTVVVKSLCK